MDIKGFFDNINHEKLLLALDKHVEEKWVKMYVKRWLTAPVQNKAGELIYKEGKGTPQGGVISPLLANLFLHYAFDQWLTLNFRGVKFERYADDIVVHCRTGKQAEIILEKIAKRMQDSGLELHPDKTKIVYCKDHKRKENFKHVKFDFLGYTFKPRPAKTRDGFMFLGFDLAMSVKAGKRIVSTFRQSHFHRWTSNTIEGIAAEFNSQIQGWLNYYAKFRPSAMSYVFRLFHERLVRWVQNKYKSLRGKIRKAYGMLNRIQKAKPNLFAHWKRGFLVSGLQMTRAV